MSWIERIKNGMTITCGDGKVYEPNWLNATKELEWNTAEFDFPNVEGTFVKRSKRRGTRYSLELHFQGEFHLDTSVAFEQSMNNTKPLIIAHPFYGSLTVQGPKFLVDNTGLNVSKWTGTVIETITEANPIVSTDPIDEIAIKKNLLDESFAQALLLPPSTTDVATLKANNTSNYNLTVPIIQIPDEVEKYFNLFNTAQSAVNTATASPLLAMRTTIAMLTEPASFAISVTQRIGLLTSTFNTFRATLSGLLSPASKQIYQNLAGSVISSMCLAASLPLDGDFSNNKKVYDLITAVTTPYNQYIADLDALQTLTGGSPTSFVPNADSLIALNTLMNTTISSLFRIALTSKVERSIICENDTNMIILTHRFYGLDSFDNNIAELIEENGIGLTELIQVKKGRKIVYYI